MSVKTKTNMFFRMFVTRIKHPPEKEITSLDNDLTEASQKLLFPQDTNSEDTSGDTDEEIITGNIKGNVKVIKILKETGDIDINHIPQICLSKINAPTLLYLLNKNTAKEFASVIAKDILQSNVPVVEINSGPGFITEELLKAGVPKIYMYERNEEFSWYLTPLLEKYANRLVLRKYNLLNLHYLQSSERNNDHANSDSKIKDIFQEIDMKEWNQEPSMQLIATVPNKIFFYELQYSMMDQYLANFGRIILYLATKPSIAKIFEDNPDSLYHKSKNIFLRNVFNYKILGSLPRASFFPYNSNYKKAIRDKKLHLEDTEKMIIIKLEANKDFLSDDFTRRDALMFLYFLRSHMRRRDARIIPELEKLMPGCGRQLIRHNLNIYSRFSELTSGELLILFKIVKSWAQFENSSFVEDLQFHLNQET